MREPVEIIEYQRPFTLTLRDVAAVLFRHQRLLLTSFCEGVGDLIVFRNHSKPVVCYCHQPLLVANEDGVKNKYLRRNRHKAAILRLFSIGFQLLDRVAWKYYGHIFVTSNTVRELVMNARLTGGRQVLMLPPGVDCASIHPSRTRKHYFLAFSRLKWWKNVDLSIRAFRLASENNWVPGFQLIVAGQVDAGSREYFHELCELANGCSDIEIIPNPTAQQVHEFYAGSYAVLNCTLREAWGMVPLEANAYGKAVIAVNRGGTAESQVHGVTGLLADPTPLDFALAMRLLAADPELTASMGNAARANAQQYDWSVYVRTLDEELDRIGENAVNAAQEDSDKNAVLAA